MKDYIQVMSVQKGHEQMEFDPSDPEDLKRIKTFIKEKMDQGWYLAVGKAGSQEPLQMIMDKRNVDEIDSEEFDRIFLMAGNRKVLNAPIASG